MAKRGLAETWGIGSEMDRCQLVQAHHVVDDDRLGGDLGEPGRASFSAFWASSTTDSVSSLLTCGIVSADNSSRSGVAARIQSHSHPATHASATVRPGHDHSSGRPGGGSLRRVGGFAAKHIGRDPPIAQD